MISDQLPKTIQVVRAGQQAYPESWELQRQLVLARRRDLVPDLLLLVEHSPTYTTGRGGQRSNLLIDDATLAEIGATFHHVDRGGDITFHGPGQLVGYVILDLAGAQRSVRRFVEQLEETIIATLQHYGLVGVIDPERPGVWIGQDKIAALGIAVSHGVTYHGFALNVDPDLRYFDYMIPCGIPDRGVTSLARHCDHPVSIDDVADHVIAHLGRLFAMVPREDFGLEDLYWAASHASIGECPSGAVLNRPHARKELTLKRQI